VRLHFCVQQTANFKAAVNPDPEMRSNGRIHNAALYCSITPNPGIRICFYSVKTINLGKIMFSVCFFLLRQETNTINMSEILLFILMFSHQLLSNLQCNKVTILSVIKTRTLSFLHEKEDWTQSNTQLFCVSLCSFLRIYH
jgi:hypothetical protein